VKLLIELDKLEGEWRIRLGSLDPDRVDGELLHLITTSRRMARHLHLSLQSGSDRILRAMRRKYTVDEYLRAVDRARSVDTRFAFTTDLIAGFPGENDSDHKESLKVVEQVEFLKVHVFRFSRRPGTEAAEMKDQIDSGTKKARSHELIEAGKRSRKKYLERQIGRKASVLIQKTGHTESSGFDEFYAPHAIEGAHEGFVNTTIISIESQREGSDAELYCRSVVR
jgi:threonylcarbamoyladenosine tRNA methylthiotransferase MtaB